ncbi:chromatin modification-related protein eaf6-like [Selaginella moellendorffii]|uniref:chromatin modification-related protein eaf6-like n=1 Tax=Selaginella moellendorffii TaxID=88036 RepID=UPI000D1CD885|nr:chromatin modification-related protein eaf6-like [Selaginella moellendorffii]|eukprot:XP_024522816.1 chromatin modification-related protein eaf6-like [Selaginella moellendorffii]
MVDMAASQQQRAAAQLNPQANLALCVSKREKLLEELRNVEKQVYDLETTYLHDSSQCGNVLKGFEGFLSSAKGAGNMKRPRKFSTEDRLFSLSSVTSPAAEENALGRDTEGRLDGSGQSRIKIAGTPANGPGKQKRRTGPRDGKRIKQMNEHDLEEEDDLDLIAR